MARGGAFPQPMVEGHVACARRNSRNSESHWFEHLVLARIFHGGRGMMADELRVAWCGQRGANSRSYSRALHAPGGMQIAASTRVGPDPNWKPRQSTKTG